MTPRAHALVYLSLGSNLGDRRDSLERAVRRLEETAGVRVTKVSSVYRSAPLGVTEQPEFANLALEAHTALAPRVLLEAVKGIERALGRTPGERWGPRVIDIDILMYDSLSVEDDDLVLPHPRMEERAFVIVPLAEIAPELTLPSGRRVAELANALQEEQDVNADFQLRG